MALRELTPQRRWNRIFDTHATLEHKEILEMTGAVSVAENSMLQLRIYPKDPVDFQTRIYLGNVLVGSTLERDRPDHLLELSPDVDSGEEYFSCKGQLLRDWAGSTELDIRVQDGDDWTSILQVGLNIAAGKISDAAFDALCREIADHSAAVLLDVFGKSFVGLRPERRHGETAPVALMESLKQVVHQMGDALRDIGRRPACRLKTIRSRQLSLPEESISELTLEEACTDPTLAVRGRTGIRFREQIQENATQDFDLPENRMLTAFLVFMKRQMADLRYRMHREIELRKSRRQYRNVRSEVGEKTWWEQEDLPRIEELQRMLSEMHPVETQISHQMRLPFLPPAPILRDVPQSTPLIRHHPAYAHAFRLIQSHFMSYRVQLDDEHLVTRARSLPVLYEWWCLLAVLRFLQGELKQLDTAGSGRGTPFRRLRDERERFVVEFEANQAIDFEDPNGRLVRIRYVPRYLSRARAGLAQYGLLGIDEERTPDIAIEVFSSVTGRLAVPESIIVIDAKYSSQPHTMKLDEVRRKYGKIGVFKSGSVLSRQVWAMSPSAPSHPPIDTAPTWASACTVDNEGFWSDEFDVQSTVTGVVQAVPGQPVGKSPLDHLLRLLLTRNNVELRPTAP